VRLLQVFDYQLAAARTVKGENQDAVWTEQPAEAARDARRELAAVNGLTAKSAGYCSIGGDQRHIRSQTKPFEQRHGVSHTATGSDSHCYASLLRGQERLGVARTDRLPEGREQRAVHVDGQEANGRVHSSSVPGACIGANRLRWG